jgi:hypothetical protein
MRTPKIQFPWSEYRSKEIPRFLYTITTKANYESMCKDGYIRPAQDILRPKMQGIFLFDLRNLTKRWTSNSFFRTQNFITQLFLALTDKSKDLVVLKVPTKNLDKPLKIRSLNYLFKNCDRIRTDVHLDYGIGAYMQKHYTQHKEPIEYIYKENIPITQVEKIGEVFIEDVKKLSRGELKVKNVLSQLFSGTPQHKTIEQMK